MQIDVQLEEWPGSPVVRCRDAAYTRLPPSAFKDGAAKLTARQAVFLRNLVRLAESLGRSSIPVDFELPNGEAKFLDRGCIKMAERSGFIKALSAGPDGLVSEIELAWAVSATTSKCVFDVTEADGKSID